MGFIISASSLYYRQTDIQTETDGRTDRQTHRQTDRQTTVKHVTKYDPSCMHAESLFGFPISLK